jgi:hypothetical protein
MNLFRFTSKIAPLAFVIGLASNVAQAGPTGWGGGSCVEINAMPANITAQGNYCLNFKNVNFALASGALITISTDNVMLDLNGATIDGLGAGDTVTGSYGIRAINRKNVTVRNGTVKGFTRGVELTHTFGIDGSDVRPTHGLVVENIRAIGNKVTGIRVEGHASVIRDNHVSDTGGVSTAGSFFTTFGIYAGGTGLRILNNDVSHTQVNGDGSAYGIYLAHPTITREVMAVNNRITEAHHGIFGGVGVPWGKYRDNITDNVTTPYTGGTDIGNNN